MKMCVNCGTTNANGLKECIKCGAVLDDSPEVKWNDFKRIAELRRQAQENEAVFGKYKKPAQVSTSTPAPEKDNAAKCPQCGSVSLSADKKGFGIGKAVVGATVAGPIGLVAGNIGAKKVRITCLKCGHQFWAGK